MSKRETPMTRRYWERVRGTLLEEYLVVRTGPGVGRPMIDAVIIEDGDHRIASRSESVSLAMGTTSSSCRRMHCASACTFWGKPFSRAS